MPSIQSNNQTFPLYHSHAYPVNKDAQAVCTLPAPSTHHTSPFPHLSIPTSLSTVPLIFQKHMTDRITVAATSQPATVVSASIVSILVDAGGRVGNTTTGRIWTSTILGTLGRLECDTSTSCRISSGSRSSIWIRCVIYVVQTRKRLDEKGMLR